MKTIERVWRFLVDLSPVRLALLLFFISFAVRVAFIVVFHPYLDLSRYELERTALSLARTGVYGNPYAAPTGPTAHVSPGYTLILAALFRIFGSGVPAEIVKELVANVVVSVQYALLPAVSGALFIDRRAGILAGLVSALYPASPLVQIDGDWEAPYTALALMWIAALSVRLWTKQDLRKRNAFYRGIAWGICILFVGALLDIWIVFLAAGLYFCSKAGLRRYLSFAGLEILVVALCLAPWAVRNLVSLGWPILTRSNDGIELRVSNNDFATGDQRINYLHGVYDRYHPLLNRAEALKVRQMGEVAYNRQARRAALDWIRAHPGRFVYLCLDRARCFWLYPDPSRIKRAFLSGSVVLGWIGFVFIFRRERVSGAVLGILLLVYPLPNYLVHVGVRQEYPIEWLMTLLSAVAILYSIRRAKRLTRVPFGFKRPEQSSLELLRG